MIEIKIWADINSTGLIDFQGSSILFEETTIKKGTWFRLQRWVEDYDDVAVMDINERKENISTIKKLDMEGISLMNQIAQEWNKDTSTGKTIKFVYYSEGLLKQLTHIDKP